MRNSVLTTDGQTDTGQVQVLSCASQLKIHPLLEAKCVLEFGNYLTFLLYISRQNVLRQTSGLVKEILCVVCPFIISRFMHR